MALPGEHQLVREYRDGRREGEVSHNLGDRPPRLNIYEEEAPHHSAGSRVKLRQTYQGYVVMPSLENL